MALTPDLLCPPCSGLGRKRVPDGADITRDHGVCPMCGGEGEVTATRLEQFWTCVQDALQSKLKFRVPWTCAEGERSWL